MSMFTDQPFSEYEERYFLAEILKKSNLSPITLITLIQEEQIEPAWNDIALPNGRSVTACQHALSNLIARTQQHQPFQPSTLQPVIPDPQRKSGKRPYSLGDIPGSGTREIQPRPVFSNYSGPQPLPSPVTMSPVEPPRKKRGRPTKAEYDIRLAEATARGEVWPKPRNKAKARRISEPITNETSTSHGAGSMDESAGETSGAVLARSVKEGSEGPPTGGMSPRSTQNLPLNIPPTTPRANVQDMIRPAGQVSRDDTRAEISSGADTGRPFFLHQPQQSQPSPVLPHQPRLPATTLQSYSPQVAPFHTTGYQSPSPRR